MQSALHKKKENKMSSHQKKSKDPTPNMADINKTLADATESMKRMKDENSMLSTRLTIERVKNDKLNKQLKDERLLLFISNNALNGSYTLVEKLRNENVTLNAMIKKNSDHYNKKLRRYAIFCFIYAFMFYAIIVTHFCLSYFQSKGVI